ncbi:MAG: glycosyltransferase family 4 protein [bacterium]|nr:glycosyltransferase family 4 protein [bacterium]
MRTLRSAARTYDVVHTHTGRAHAFAAVAGARPLVVARRVAFPVRDGWASRWKYRRGDRYIAVSRYVARKLEDAGVQGDRIGVVYDGVPVLRPAEGAKILAPASDDPRKGTALVERASKRAGFAVKFSANLPVDLAEAGIFVYLTEEEGLGSAVLLAMSAGVPVVASRVGGLPEIVEDPVTGVLVENNELEVAAAIQRLLNDPEAAAQMGRTARERVQQRFTLRHMAEQTLAVYDNVT